MVLVGSCPKGQQERLDEGVKRMRLIFCGIGKWPDAKKRGDEEREGRNGLKKTSAMIGNDWK